MENNGKFSCGPASGGATEPGVRVGDGVDHEILVDGNMEVSERGGQGSSGCGAQLGSFAAIPVDLQSETEQSRALSCDFRLLNSDVCFQTSKSKKIRNLIYLLLSCRAAQDG